MALSTAVAVFALMLAMVFVAASGASAGHTLATFFTGAFGGTSEIGSTLTNMVPLVLIALGWIVVSRGGHYHVGFPGQVMIGGLFTGVVTVTISGLPAVLDLPLGIASGVIGGALYAGIATWLWVRFGVNEILSTLLLNLVAAQVVTWSVNGPLEGPGGLPQSNPLQAAAVWPTVPGYPLLGWEIVLVPIAVATVAFVLRSTTFGLRLRTVGANPVAARYAGMFPQRLAGIAIVTSGALAGLAGSVLIQAGYARAVTDGFEGGYGFQGIAVALLARNSPVGCIPAALLFAALNQGGGVVEAEVGVSSAVVEVTQGLVICLVTGAAGLLYVLQKRRQQSVGADPLVTASDIPEDTVGVW